MTECRNLDEVRIEIDRLDRDIAALLAERAGYVAQAARFKPTVEAVVIPERIEAVVRNVRDHAQEHGVDPDLLEAIYRPMIAAYIAFERQEWLKTKARN